MEPAIHPPDDQDLAAHGRFLRGLAGSLVADPASADDAVQEAWLAALRRRPDADRPLRPWLARVVVNAVKKLGRGRARRAAREHAAARPEALPDARALREREQRLRGLLDAVLALPERERETVLLRYYEALPPREIATRLRQPVEQVYARLKRALALLRERLDAQHGGNRSTWALGLVGVLGLPRELLPAALTVGGTASGGAAAGFSSAAVIPTLTGAVLMSSSTATVAAVVVSLALGAGAGWFIGSRDGAEAPAAPGRSSAESGAAEGLSGPGSGVGSKPALAGQDPATQSAILRKELAAAKDALAAREKELAEAKEQIKALAPPPFDPKALRFGIKGATPTFDKADWESLAGHAVALSKVLHDLQKSRSEGKPMGPEFQAAVGEHNTPLAVFAVGAASELKGTGPNGAFTHPAVIANLIRAALIAAKDPLTPAQETAVVALGNAWVADWDRTEKSFDEDDPALAKTVAEVDAKQRFLDAVQEVLSPSQRARLFHPEIVGRLGLDLLSPTLVYIGMAPVETLDPEALPNLLVTQFLAVAGMKAVDPAPFLSIGQRWLDDIPGSRDAHTAADVELMSPTVAMMQAWARAQVAAIRRLVESGRLTPEQVKAARRVTTLLIPYVVKAG